MHASLAVHMPNTRSIRWHKRRMHVPLDVVEEATNCQELRWLLRPAVQHSMTTNRRSVRCKETWSLLPNHMRPRNLDLFQLTRLHMCFAWQPNTRHQAHHSDLLAFICCSAGLFRLNSSQRPEAYTGAEFACSMHCNRLDQSVALQHHCTCVVGLAVREGLPGRVASC